ncbi:hypothetical protein D8Y34_25030 [Escherichia coli]|nr:hypothetical protein D8Y34_25030 [Escherichia coli]
MATLSDTIKPNKTYLEAVLRTALLGKTEDEYVDFFLSGWICPYISRHLLSLNPLLACCRRYSRGER